PFDRTFNFFSTVFPIKKVLTLGVSWIGLRVNEIEGRSFNSAEPEFTFSSHQNAVFISLAKSLNSVLSIGGNIKLIKNKLNNLSATGLGFDASLMLRPFNQVKLGLLVQDIGTDYRWNGGSTEGVPLNYILGFSWKIYNGVTLAADVHKTAGMAPEIRLGGEVRPVNALPIRMGLNDKQFSCGAGFVLPLSEHLLELNYSYSNDKVFNDAIHRFSLIFSFGGRSDHFSNRRKKMVPFKKMAAKNVDEVKYMIIVNVKILNVRSGPGKKFRKIDQILKGQKFEAFEKSGNWWKIKLNSSTMGWVHENYIGLIKNE
ncbi:MAG: SH3 domain-containing protein, partial [bacterium]